MKSPLPISLKRKMYNEFIISSLMLVYKNNKIIFKQIHKLTNGNRSWDIRVNI